MPKRVIFLDRDGTLNVDDVCVYEIEKWEWTSGAIDALKILQNAGYKLAVITNQSGIGHGIYTEHDMHVLHEYMNNELEKHGVHLDVIAFCPHARDDKTCDCRKPNTGMVRQVENIISDIDFANSWTIGDKEADVLFGKKIGTKTALIRSKYWGKEDLSAQPNLVVESLEEATEKILLKI